MPKPRSQQISLIDTKHYHVYSRTVRKAMLCGTDKESGLSYEYRRKWIVSRLSKLTQAFSIKICAYAVMHNHLHLVVHIDDDIVSTWSINEVLERWHKIFKGTLLTQQYLNNEPLNSSQKAMIESTANIYRQRLMDISWFMRSLCEPIARRANEEDDCKGHFWEGRFKSQALLDEKALLACMAYVDLNPIRAGISTTPEKSMFTSIQQRIKLAVKGKQPKELLPFIGSEHLKKSIGIKFNLKEYLLLVDETSRKQSKSSNIVLNGNVKNILSRLQINQESWFKLTRDFEKIFTGAVGSADNISEFTSHVGLHRAHGIYSAKNYLNSA
ncbi:MAG: transposase [Colwellia sp.]